MENEMKTTWVIFSDYNDFEHFSVLYVGRQWGRVFKQLKKELFFFLEPGPDDLCGLSLVKMTVDDNEYKYLKSLQGYYSEEDNDKKNIESVTEVIRNIYMENESDDFNYELYNDFCKEIGYDLFDENLTDEEYDKIQDEIYSPDFLTNHSKEFEEFVEKMYQ